MLHVFGKWVMGDKPPGKTERGVFGFLAAGGDCSLGATTVEPAPD